MFGNNDGIPGNSYHNDVLLAEPSDNSDKLRLVEELKNRAKGSIKQQNYPEAIQLYKKALSVIPTEDKSAIAILHANISMCQLAIKKFQDALESAEDAITNDASYIKGYFRKGMAFSSLKKYNDAMEAFTQGLLFKPDDKDLLMQLNKVKNELENKPMEEEKSLTKVVKTTTERTTPSRKLKSEESKATEKDDDIDSNKPIRGYKTTSDGRKTTFFNNEMDEETKKLIGDIAPKQIDSSEPEPVVTAVTGSVWNAAGTFESVDHTPWSKNRIQELLEAVSYVSPNNALNTAIVKKINSVEGDAEITTLRMKRKHVYDFTISIRWKATINSELVEGDVVIEDITADGEYEVSSFSIDNKQNVLSAEVNKFVTLEIKNKQNGFISSLYKALKEFEIEFKSK